MSERTYTESEHQQAIQLERAAILREAVDVANMRIKTDRERGIEGDEICAELLDDLKAIPTDQPALDRHDAELEARFNKDWFGKVTSTKRFADMVAERVREEAEWWAKNSIEDTLQSRRERSQRLAALRAAAGAPEETNG